MSRRKYRGARQLPETKRGGRRDEDLPKRAEAGRLRGATTTAPHRSDQPNTAATYDIHRLCTTVTEDLHIRREDGGDREKDLPVIIARKKNIPHAKPLRRVLRFNIHARLNPLSPERSICRMVKTSGSWNLAISSRILLL